MIQAFSRTNRILNSVKTFGNIVCFRNLETATNNALALFGDKNARGMVILKTYNEYMKGYEDEHGKHIEGYNELVTRLVNEFPIGSQIIGEDNEKNFIKLFLKKPRQIPKTMLYCVQNNNSGIFREVYTYGNHQRYFVCRRQRPPC